MNSRGKYITVGRMTYPGYTIKFSLLPPGEPLPAFSPELFCTALIKDFRIPGYSVLCLGPETDYKWTSSLIPPLYACLFQAEFINQRLDLRALKGEIPFADLTTKQDAYLLHSFLGKHEGSGIPLKDTQEVSRIQELYKSMAEQIKTEPELWPCRTRSYLMEMLILLRRLSERPVREGPTAESWLQALQSIVLTEYRNPPSLEAMARRVGASRTSAAVKFRETFGCTVFEAVQKKRMELAAALLRTTTLPIPHIMDRIGLESQSAFTRSFKQWSGLPPLKYRKDTNSLI